MINVISTSIEYINTQQSINQRKKKCTMVKFFEKKKTILVTIVLSKQKP